MKLSLEYQVMELFDQADHSAARFSNVNGMMSAVENTTDTVDTLGGAPTDLHWFVDMSSS